jgi:predicted transcriptional regulator
MTTFTIELDDRTAKSLQHLSETEGTVPDEMAARLLRRAVRQARPPLQYDREALRAYMVQAGDEEAADAEAGVAERAALLDQEDCA